MAEPTNDEFVSNPHRIRCADAIELVTDHLDGALSAHDIDVFQSHLATCEACRVFVDQIKMTITLTGAIGGAQIEVMPTNFDTLVTELARRAGRS